MTRDIAMHAQLSGAGVRRRIFASIDRSGSGTRGPVKLDLAPLFGKLHPVSRLAELCRALDDAV
ncbi:MAG: hypothetical protein ACXVHB_15025, partial [Solirubrobacteraceae bacterium]